MTTTNINTTANISTWDSTTTAEWVAEQLGLSDDVAAAATAQFTAHDIEGDGLLGNMRRVEKVLAQQLLVGDGAGDAVAALCEARDAMHSSAVTPRRPHDAAQDWARTLASPEEAEVRAALQAAVEQWRAGRWVLSKQLGRGGSGVVFAAEDTRLGKVAIKFTHCAERGKLEREAALMQRVSHQHVCRMFEHTMLDSLHAMVLELLTKGTLEELRKRSAGARIREFECVRMASHVLSALGFMHGRGVIHRDIKPSNIMLTDGEEDHLVFKLIDLSVSAIEQTAQGHVSDTLATNTTGLQAQVGTPHFMSPEQITASVAVTPQTDLWSLGVVLFECLSGVKPFAPATSDQLSIAYAVVNTEAPMLPDIIAEVGTVSDKMAAFVSRSLQKDRSARFKDAVEMSAALEETLSAGEDDSFALFISYRVWCDKEFAQALYKATSATQLREGPENRMKVYLDKVRLLDGQRFDVGFIKGLASSTCFTPLMSQDCMKSFAVLEQTDKADFVLMEWIVAIELHKCGVVKSIFPIVMGQQADDGKFEQFFFEKLLQGEVDGKPLPDMVSKKTTEKAREFLSMLDPPVELSQELTVKQVVETILTFQAVLLHFENDAIDQQTGLTRQGSVSMRTSHGMDNQDVAQKHVISVCAERIAKVVKSFQPPTIYTTPDEEGFTVALDVPEYDPPHGMVAEQIKEAQDLRTRKIRQYKGFCCALLCAVCMALALLLMPTTVEPPEQCDPVTITHTTDTTCQVPVPGFDGFYESYTVSGCSDPAHCGVYKRVSAHCTTQSDWCPGGRFSRGKTNSTLCDGAPVYQRAGYVFDGTTKLVIFPTDHGIPPNWLNLDNLEDQANAAKALMSGNCPAIENMESMTPDPAGSCFELRTSDTCDRNLECTYIIVTAGLSGIAVYAQHAPSEFERDSHYFYDSSCGDSSCDIEPLTEHKYESDTLHGFEWAGVFAVTQNSSTWLMQAHDDGNWGYTGPVLFRVYYSGEGGNTQWRVGSSDALAVCAESESIYLQSQSTPGPGYAPTAPSYSAGGGWEDDAGECYINCNISVTSECSQKVNAHTTSGTVHCRGETGDVCLYSCAVGYEDSGGGSVMCGTDRKFTDGGCSAKPCDPLTIPHTTDNGGSTTCTGSTGDTCMYTCAEGYEDSCSGSVVCGADGQFTEGGCSTRPELWQICTK
eukprot:COSAG02_NODE_3903_length_6061_cov_2.511238_1_plen_1174_part_00